MMQLKTIGLTEKANEKLKNLVEEGHIGSEADGYRLGVALALAHQIQPPDTDKTKTKFNIGTLDPNRELILAIKLLTNANSVTKDQIEGLAHWGIVELYGRVEQNGTVPLTEFIDQFVSDQGDDGDGVASK